MRALVSAWTRGLLLSARETVEWETPATLAISLIETRGWFDMVQTCVYLSTWDIDSLQTCAE
jgi:hypothetical protein